MADDGEVGFVLLTYTLPLVRRHLQQVLIGKL
jgi:hypothetical protein